MNGTILYLHALSPIHCGTGQAVGVIDLPIARERATNWPQIPGSSLKGVLRDGWTGDDVERRFGSTERAGEVQFGDQRILFLAVRSYFGAFAYVTCPLALERLRRDARALGAAGGGEIPFPFSDPGQGKVAVAESSVLVHDGKVYLEDIDLGVTQNRVSPGPLGKQLFSEANEGDSFRSRVAVVADDLFTFLCETATEVTARVRLNDDTKTVADGGLWYEEAVPAESIFAGPVVARDADSINDLLPQGGVIQIGGDATTGRGLCRAIFAGGGRS
jgi:CRISPR-associated protein Cmr4